MNPVHFIRGSLALAVMPFLTAAVSLGTLIDMRWGRKDPNKALQFPSFWGRALCAIAGIRVRVTGRENIDPDKTYIFVGNHTSQTDIWTFQGFIPHHIRWVAKKELFAIPLFGAAMRSVGFVSIDRARGRAAVKSLNDAAGQIAGGASVILFPEGTRSPDGRLRPFKTGAIMLAIKAGVPVVPVGFNGNHQVLPKGSLIARSGPVELRIGTPIATTGFKAKDKQELALRLQQEVADLLDEAHQPLPGE
jgi:1-acyl-sn-glycerol-3-phosphate acyltransferase